MASNKYLMKFTKSRQL